MKRIFHFKFTSFLASPPSDKEMPSVADIHPSFEPPTRKPSVPPSSVSPVPTPAATTNGRPNGHANSNGHARPKDVLNTYSSRPAMFAKFIESYDALTSFQSGAPVVIDGNTLSIPAVTAAARYGASVNLSDSPEVRRRVSESRQVIVGKVDAEKSVYGVSTGFGGSADTRTNNPLLLGHALLQHQHTGVLPSNTNSALSSLPLSDPLTSTSMPEAWVRGAILIRMNSLIRGHSGVRWELIEKMSTLLRENITPLVPLRGSISASGDLSPLSYIAGTLIGNPSIRVFDGPAAFGARKIVPSDQALAAHGVEPIPLSSKEHLGILNGTAFSASVAALALNDAVHLTLLAQVCTAMGTEAMLGSTGSFEPFIHAVARPHPGQVEVAANILDLLEGSRLATGEEEECHIEEDAGELRQDRYPLRTSAQFLGPQVEDILSALEVVTLECNCTTDNPLIDGETGTVHHGGNFQAMAVTNAMEKTRLSLHHIGKLMFAQCTELVNPTMNRGLPPNLAATDPSHNYFAKGIDIHTAAYVGELGYLANPVSTHIQSAELHNQAVNSLALISARATINSLEVLSLLTSSYILALCQALDLRALQYDFSAIINTLTRELLTRHFSSHLSTSQLDALYPRVTRAIEKALDTYSNSDAIQRLQQVASATTTPIVEFCAAEGTETLPALANIMPFRAELAEAGALRLNALRAEYLEGKKGAAPASQYLGKTKAMYEFVRVTLGVRMHGLENLHNWEAGPGVEEPSIGQDISLIHEAIRDGRMQPVVVQMLHKA